MIAMAGFLLFGDLTEHRFAFPHRKEGSLHKVCLGERSDGGAGGGRLEAPPASLPAHVCSREGAHSQNVLGRRGEGGGLAACLHAYTHTHAQNAMIIILS